MNNKAAYLALASLFSSLFFVSTSFASVSCSELFKAGPKWTGTVVSTDPIGETKSIEHKMKIKRIKFDGIHGNDRFHYFRGYFLMKGKTIFFSGLCIESQEHIIKKIKINTQNRPLMDLVSHGAVLTPDNMQLEGVSQNKTNQNKYVVTITKNNPFKE